ncbi:hypothetical protein ACFWBF_34140 [Streptomyces sp. NPDC060028]|uniref:hypothetical protein n=1 Tax=Streptomyces sp. NPDC060028 TaxID=3347041 RepID=UPI0036C045F3
MTSQDDERREISEDATPQGRADASADHSAGCSAPSGGGSVLHGGGVGLVASDFATVEELDLDAGFDADMTDRAVTLLRRDDMLVLQFGFSGITRTGKGTAQRLVTTSPTAPGFLHIVMPPQAMLEQATVPGGASTGLKQALLSKPSQVSFKVPPGTSIPLTAAGLLSWAGLPTDSARLECVWGLAFVPAALGAVTWLHTTEPVTGPSGATGIWHTRLTLPPGASDPLQAPSRLPVPVKSAGAPEPAQGFTSSLSAAVRSQIATAMNRRPVLARDTALSALGATVDLTGNWTGIAGVGVSAYRHQSVCGRDVVVKVLQRGYLLPFGFPVQIATQTERRLDQGLVQTSFLTILMPEITYDGVAALPNEGRGFPFDRVRLNGPLVVDVSDTGEPLADVGFWVRGPGASDGRLRFVLTAEDRRRHPIAFTAPLVFIQGDRAHGGLEQALVQYNAKAQQLSLPASGRLEMAPAPGASAESSTVDLAALYVGAEVSSASQSSLEEAGRLAAHPRLVAVEARVPALDSLAPHDAIARADGVGSLPRRLELDNQYVRMGLAATQQVYAQVKPAVSLAPPVTGSGGIAKLDLPVTGLSRTAGLVGGDLEKFKHGEFDPHSYFTAPTIPPPPAVPEVPTRLLGFINLADPHLVQAPATPTGVGDGEEVPRMVTEVLHPAGKPPEGVRTTLTWHPKLTAGTFGPLQTTSATKLDMRNVTTVRLDGTAPVTETRGQLQAFKLSFAGVLEVNFRQLGFTSRPGSSPSLDVKIGEVQFSGPLKFLDRLREYLPSAANGPRIAVGTSGIEVGYSLAIPTVALGAFMLSNLALSASVTLPFNGDPVRATFGVSSREHPFLLTVSLFGGGGFLSLTVETGKVVALEAQVEFGAAAALNLGVASGSVCVTAGVYFSLDNGQSTLKGFFRAVGELDILGIVNISVEFYLALEFRSPRTVHGWASVTVRVRVAFFSKSVTMKLERSFGGGDDPTFAQAFPTPQPWRDRCAAFAPMEDA